jgi:WD40 repeat protein
LSEAAALARELEMETSVIHELRDETVACLALADIRPVKSWLGFPEGTTDSITFDADLQRYSRGDAKGNTEVRQVEDDRLLARLPGHGPGGEHSGTSTCRFSPDGQLLAVRYWHQIPGAQPGNCQVWDWQQQKVVFQPPFRVCSSPMAFSADGRSLALGEQNGTITVYQVHGWKGKQLKAAFTPTALAFHPDGTRLAVCGQNGMIQVWAMPACKELYKASVPKYACSIAWHSELLAVGCGDKNIHLFDTESGRAHLVLRGHQMGPTVLNFAAAGDGLVSACWDGTSRLWDPWSGRELLRFPAAADHVSRDGTRIAGREGRTLTVWDLNAGREYLALPPGTGGEIQELAVSPSGRWLVAGGDQPRIWDLGLRKGVATLPGSRVGAPRFHPKRPEFFTSGLNGLYRWSFAEGPMGLRVQPVDRLLPPDVGRFGMDRDGRQAVVARGIGATVITLENPPGKASMLNHRACTSAGISPDGRWAATGTHNGFGVRIWDVRTGGQVAELMPQERLTVPTFSPDGRWLLIATEFKFAIWASSTWQPIREIPREQAGGAAPATFAPDGKILAAAISTTTVGLFDTQTWRILTKLQSPDEGLLRHMTFTPDGAQLLVATLDNSIRIWDLRRVREQLAQADLDWNHLPYRPAPETDALRPVRVEVDSLLPVSESK